MKRNRFTQEQIIAILPKQEPGQRPANVCHKHGIGIASLYKW